MQDLAGVDACLQSAISDACFPVFLYFPSLCASRTGLFLSFSLTLFSYYVFFTTNEFTSFFSSVLILYPARMWNACLVLYAISIDGTGCQRVWRV
ncbi:hypothetical protein DFH27DRAFT_247121 [Peziza echinospora]|nr:hypothetical protein DFH27DRAFT_247121 [Peziza echinospora]